MATSFVVVDGSNIATEGRSKPSLAQLDEAVREYQAQFPAVQVIVVVDATFGHRIDPGEKATFEEAVAHSEIVSPPAGAIGRGDAFLLRIAERAGAQVLSNDSFQEFHGEHPWLFDEGRLIGGTPVPGVGWIFVPRVPVRGAKSRAAISAAKTVSPAKAAAKGAVKAAAKAADVGKAVKATAKAAKGTAKATKGTAKATKGTAKGTAKATKVPAKAPAKGASRGGSARSVDSSEHPRKAPSTKTAATKGPPEAAKKRPSKPQPQPEPQASSSSTATTGSRGVARPSKRSSSRPPRRLEAALKVATEEVLEPRKTATRDADARRTRGSPASPVNDPLTFLRFVTEHPIGSTVNGSVSSFTSHGAMVDVGQMRCYVPLSGLGDPAPRRAREVLERGERRSFVLVSLDPPHRSAELALPAKRGSRKQH